MGSLMRESTAKAEQDVDGETRLRAMGDEVRGIFMHIHKCAGTSLIRGVASQEHVISVVARPGNFENRTGVERVPTSVWDTAYRFTFVRNPYARILSAYRMFAKSKKWSSCFENFDRFVDTLQWFDVGNHKVEDDIPSAQFAKSIDTIIHHCSTFSNPKYRVSEMNFVGKVEYIENGIEEINSAIQCRIPLIHLNKSAEQADYREVYSSRTKRLVEQIYYNDFECFGYDF